MRVVSLFAARWKRIAYTGCQAFLWILNRGLVAAQRKQLLRQRLEGVLSTIVLRFGTSSSTPQSSNVRTPLRI